MYVLVQDGALVLPLRTPRKVEAKLLDGALLSPPDGRWTDALAAACGFLPVTEPVRPAITVTQTFDPDTIELVAGVPTRVYHVRDKTQAELDDDAAAARDALERQQARDAVAELDTFLALQTPTNAQVVAVVRLLCRVAKRLIRDTFQ